MFCCVVCLFNAKHPPKVAFTCIFFRNRMQNYEKILFRAIVIAIIGCFLELYASVRKVVNRGVIFKLTPKNRPILQSTDSIIMHFYEKYAFFIVFSWSNKFFAVLLQRLSNSNQLGASVPTLKKGVSYEKGIC